MNLRLRVSGVVHSCGIMAKMALINTLLAAFGVVMSWIRDEGFNRSWVALLFSEDQV